MNENLTEEEVVKRANELARGFYELTGHAVRVGYRFDRAQHPAEQLMWRLAVMAFDFIAETDVENALAEIGE